MNESLRRALLRARLTEEDVAARLQVDPKTVRRWLEGRIPYPRHRWVLATTLGLDEDDLWPQLGAWRSRPQEIQAIYPHREDVPREVWVRLFGRAQKGIDILGVDSPLFLAADPEMLTILADRASTGVRERICLCDADALDSRPQISEDAPAGNVSDALARYSALRHCGDVEVRLHTVQLRNAIYRSDDECLVAPSVFGISAPRTPVIYLRCTRGNDLFQSYLKGFESIWASSNPP